MRIHFSLVIFFLIMHCFNVRSQPQDHKNNIVLWTAGGYSSILNETPKSIVLGNAGMAFGAGYEMHWNLFIMQIGVELSYYTSRMNLEDSLYIVPMIDSEGTNFMGHFTFRNTNSIQRMFNTSFPILLGYKSEKGYYFLIGGKLLYNWKVNSSTTSNVTSQAQYNNIIGDNNGLIGGMPNHELDTQKRVVENTYTFHPSLTGSFEAGLPISKQRNQAGIKNNSNLRLALFCDYSILSFNNKYRSDNLIVNVSKSSLYMPAINGFLFYNTKSNVMNSVFVGLKLTAVFGMKKKICSCSLK